MKKLYKSYTELLQIDSFEERFEYLRLKGLVGEEVDHLRWVKQNFYRSPEWRKARRDVIVRDFGCDLGIKGREIQGRIIIHHLNPITIADLENQDPIVTNPENLICVSFDTHNAIHYGDCSLLVLDPIERKPGDTCPWRR